MEIKINEFAQEVHENAIAHGWWDEKRSFPGNHRAHPLGGFGGAGGIPHGV